MLLAPRRNLLAVGLVVALLLASLAAAPAAVAAGPTACPATFPTKQAVDGVTGVGYTVERGTTPDPFTAQILGRIDDGIAPGVDMIMADLDSPALDRAGGVWQGMSGSPVYASDGRLIGSVSYGLSFGPSSIAGLTPAASMKPILTQLATAATREQANAAMRERVALPMAAADRLRATGEMTAAQASGGFQQLDVPLWVSSASTSGKQTMFDRLQQRAPGTRVFAGGARAPSTPAPASSITAGGNFVAGLSYGLATLAATGTTTFVCDGKAVAFGHPFFSAGSVRMSAHPATAVYVQPDPSLLPSRSRTRAASPARSTGTC
jgi:SpoIVB peptidase S55